MPSSNDRINLGIGFDSQNVDEATRALKSQARVIGALIHEFEKLQNQSAKAAEAEEKVEEQLQSIGTTFGKVKTTLVSGMSAIKESIIGMIPGAGIFFNILDKVLYVAGQLVGLALMPIVLPFKWIVKNGLKVINWATDFGARFREISDAALELESRFTRLANLTGSEKFANSLNNWQYQMLQTLPILRDDLDDFTVQMRELGLDPSKSSEGLRGLIGAAVGPGNSYSQVASAVMSAAEGGDLQSLYEALGRTVAPEELYRALQQGAPGVQGRFNAILDFLNTKYGKNVDRENRKIATSFKQIGDYWSEFKEQLVGTPEKGNLMWYIQEVFVKSKNWIKENKTSLMSFAKSIQQVLGGIGKVLYNFIAGFGKMGSKAIGGIQGAAEKFKEWALHTRIVLEKFALKIQDIFKKSEKEGAGFFGTLQNLWDGIFGNNKSLGDVLSSFWDKFKETGRDVINWMGEQIGIIMGRSVKDLITDMFTKKDGTLSNLAPDFVERHFYTKKADQTLAGMTDQEKKLILPLLRSMGKNRQNEIGYSRNKQQWTPQELAAMKKAGAEDALSLQAGLNFKQMKLREEMIDRMIERIENPEPVGSVNNSSNNNSKNNSVVINNYISSGNSPHSIARASAEGTRRGLKESDNTRGGTTPTKVVTTLN